MHEHIKAPHALLRTPCTGSYARLPPNPTRRSPPSAIACCVQGRRIACTCTRALHTRGQCWQHASPQHKLTATIPRGRPLLHAMSCRKLGCKCTRSQTVHTHAFTTTEQNPDTTDVPAVRERSRAVRQNLATAVTMRRPAVNRIHLRLYHCSRCSKRAPYSMQGPYTSSHAPSPHQCHKAHSASQPNIIVTPVGGFAQ